MNRLDFSLQRKSINRGVLGVLGLVFIGFIFFLVILQIQNYEINRLEKIANEYHLSINKKSLRVMSLIENIQLWFRDRHIAADHAVESKKHLVPDVSFDISTQDKIDALQFSLDKEIREMRRIQDEFSAYEGKINSFILTEQAYAKFISSLKKLNSKGYYSYKQFDEIIAPLAASVHQLYRLHNQEYKKVIEETKEEEDYNFIQSVGLVGLLALIGIIGVFKMLSYINQSLLELSEVKKEVAYNEARFSSMFESISDAVFVIDAEHKMSLLNSSVIKLFGYKESELIGKTLDILYSNPDDFHHAGKKRHYYDEHGEPLPYEVIYERKDGSVFIGETLSSKITSNNGISFGYVGVVRDITDRKRAENEIKELNLTLEDKVKKRTEKLESTLFLLTDENEQRKKAEIQFKKAKERAEKASAAKSDFLSRMSHELRTPMNAILGFGQLLKFDSKDFNDTQNSNIEEILQAGSHLLRLINDVLDLTEIEAGKLEISMKDVKLDDVVQQCISLMEPILKEQQITLSDNISGTGYILYADITRLKQVLLNLLNNAVKYNNENGSITLDSQLTANKYLRISISDTGNGIKKEDISKLFTSFERLNPKLNVEGTGIGLNIAKNMVELMGGNIGVTSTVGKGSTFYIELELLNKKSLN